MGISQSIYAPFYNGKQLLNGDFDVNRSGKTYSGHFKDGYLVSGKITNKQGDVLSEGAFAFNALKKGFNVENFKEMLDKFVPKYLHDQFIGQHLNLELYVVGSYCIPDNLLSMPELHGSCTIYFDRELTDKFIDGEFEEDKLVSGTIFLPDRLMLASGTFNQDPLDIDVGVVAHHVDFCLADRQMMYQKIFEDSERQIACYANDYNGYAEFYYDDQCRKLAIKCDMVNDEIHGKVAYYFLDKLIYQGLAKHSEITRGCLYRDGFYVASEFDDNNEPNGIATLYYDEDCTQKYADVNFLNGEYHGLVTIYKNNKPTAHNVYAHGELIDQKTCDTDESFTITEDEKFESYKTWTSVSGEKFVKELDLKKVLDDHKPRNTNNVFINWLSNKLVEYEWLTSVNQSEKSYFSDYVGDEIENVQELAKDISKSLQDKTSPIKQLYAMTLFDILSESKNYDVNPDFTEVLLADIYQEFLDYCFIAYECEIVTKEEYVELVKVPAKYIKNIKKSGNSFLSNGQTKPKKNPSFKNWLADKLENDNNYVRSTLTPYLFGIVKSRAGNATKNNSEFAESILNQLSGPLQTDIRNNRSAQMLTCYETLHKQFMTDTNSTPKIPE